MHHPKFITKNVLHFQLHQSPSLTIHYIATPCSHSFSISVPPLTVRPYDALRSPILLTSWSSSSWSSSSLPVSASSYCELPDRNVTWTLPTWQTLSASFALPCGEFQPAGSAQCSWGGSSKWLVYAADSTFACHTRLACVKSECGVGRDI